MPRNASRYGKRNRERRSSPVVVRWEWRHWGRLVAVVEVTKCGGLRVTVPHPERVGGGERGLAVAELAEFLPRLTAAERHELLWG